MHHAVSGRAITARAPRYLSRLTARLSRTLQVHTSDSRAVVRYKDTVMTLTPTEDSLEFALSGIDRDELIRAMHVVTSHLERFGAKDSLTCTWDDPDLAAAYASRRPQLEADHARARQQSKETSAQAS